jgi:cysteine/O-acetylserine efflux protein
MEVNVAAFLSFIIITSFTPGPNNIACASFGMLIGYRQTFKFILGVLAGFLCLLIICAVLSNFLLQSAPFINDYLKYIGALYILWLAYHTMKASYQASEEVKQLASFGRGFVLQLVNPKGIFYGMTIFTTFLSGANGNLFLVAPWLLGLLVVGFCSVSTWTLFGNLIQRYLQNARLKQAVNIVLALALVLTAMQIAEVF